FLRFALTAAPPGQSAPFALTAISPGELAGQDLKKFPLVILANVERLAEGAVEKLEQYADEGGKVLIFLGDWWTWVSTTIRSPRPTGATVGCYRGASRGRRRRPGSSGRWTTSTGLWRRFRSRNSGRCWGRG